MDKGFEIMVEKLNEIDVKVVGAVEKLGELDVRVKDLQNFVVYSQVPGNTWSPPPNTQILVPYSEKSQGSGENKEPRKQQEEDGQEKEPDKGEEEAGQEKEPKKGEEEDGQEKEPEKGEEEDGQEKEPEKGEEEDDQEMKEKDKGKKRREEEN